MSRNAGRPYAVSFRLFSLGFLFCSVTYRHTHPYVRRRRSRWGKSCLQLFPHGQRGFDGFSAPSSPLPVTDTGKRCSPRPLRGLCNDAANERPARGPRTRSTRRPWGRSGGKPACASTRSAPSLRFDPQTEPCEMRSDAGPAATPCTKIILFSPLFPFPPGVTRRQPGSDADVSAEKLPPLTPPSRTMPPAGSVNTER